MDKSAEEEGLVTVPEETQQQERSKSRRLVQSTLLPHKSTAIESKSEQKSHKECNGDDKDGDNCENQGKKKRARKQKENPQSETPKVNKRAKEKSSPEATPEKDVMPKKAAKRGPRKNGTPRKNATPRKNGTINGKTAPHMGENGDAMPQIPNLRLEAKMMAEENSRVFGGKQIHPFFLSRNASSRCHEKPIPRKLKGITFGPIHVFEREQDGAVSLDWRNWKFCEDSFINSSCTQDGPFSSIFECTGKSLCFDEFPSVSNPSGSLLCPDNLSSNKASPTAVSLDVQVDQLVKHAEDYQVDEVVLISGCERNSDEQQSQYPQERAASFHLGCANQLDSRLWTDKYQPKKSTELCGNDDSVKILSEWLRTWCRRGRQANRDEPGGDECDIQDPDYNCFRDDSDSENISEEGSFKNVLLITGPVGSGKSAAIYACAKEQGFRVLEASASECRNGALMKERFGALESQSTLDSQLLQWSQESSVEFQSVDDMKSPTVIPNSEVLQEHDNQGTEVIPISDEVISHEASETSEKFVYKDNSVACGQGQLKPLILFEDVDIVFAEDRGFISAIQQIADKIKGPVILTSNSNKPFLPDNLDRLELCFKMPLEKELLQHLCMVCSAEKVNVQPRLIEHLIDFCQRDIRKTIMHLQFWCQGEQFTKGRVSEVQRLSSLLPFDLEAGYQIFPKMIPWEFPSQLAELVMKEIAMSLCTMEDVIENQFDDHVMQSNMERCISETDSIEAKKKAMLSNNCSDHDCIDFFDFLDSSSNPLAFSLRNSRRKLAVVSSDSEDELLNGGVATTPDKDAGDELCVEVDQSPSHCRRKLVMSSDSEGELLNGGVQTLLNKDASNELCVQVDDRCPFHCPSVQKSFSPSTELQLFSGAEKLEENLHQFSETSIDLNVKDTCVSIGVSCVPESSFVPETDINNGIEFSFGRVSGGQVGQASEILEEASVSNEFRQHVFTIGVDKFDEFMPKLHKDSDMPEGTCEFIAVSSHEEVEDSQIELIESITREHQLMDECSCIDFSRKVKPHEICRSSMEIDAVRESWRKLRDRRGDLGHFVAAEHKCSEIIEIACEMSNLISEAEVLHLKCQSLDSLGLPMIYSEESDAFSWSNEQLQMTSAILEHGFCFHAKGIAAAGMDMGFDSRVDSGEMPCTNSKIKVGGVLGQNVKGKQIDTRVGGVVSWPENATLPNSEKPQLVDIIRSMVPSRAYMTIKGNAFCEYRSSLGHMSRAESCRLSEGVNKTKRRRGRAARNYLSTGSLMLSSEEVSLLGQSNLFGNISTQSTD